jgi:hypothetical protein
MFFAFREGTVGESPCNSFCEAVLELPVGKKIGRMHGVNMII